MKNNIMNIPKVIHFCWFGYNALTPLAERCIQSWNKYCLGYKIQKWDENNFDIHKNKYVEEAYKLEKWAFVTDYVRLYILFYYGGIYMDADFELVKDIDELLEQNDAFTGYQEESTIPAAIMGFTPGNIWIKTMLDYYTDRHFVDSEGSMDLTTNSKIITKLSQLNFNYSVGDHIINPGNVKLYPDIYFAPYKKTIIGNNITALSNYTINPDTTYGVHHGVGSWYDKTIQRRLSVRIKGIIRLLSGEYLYSMMKKFFMKLKVSKVKI